MDRLQHPRADPRALRNGARHGGPVKLRGSRSGEIVLKSVRPSAGIEAKYRKQMLRLIDAMQKSVEYWVRAAWRANEPRMAQDATPAELLRRVVDELHKRWTARFDDAASELADYFAEDVSERSDAVLRAILRRGGWTVRFKTTPLLNDVLKATTIENVGLIRSIPERYFQEIEGLVMRSVQQGRDLETLTNELQERYAVTRRRATLIARDQNNKATATIVRTRQKELGVREAVWMHSHAGKKPRPTHVRMDGKRYNIDKGMWDPHEGKYIFPGELINCRCTSRAVIPGFA